MSIEGGEEVVAEVDVASVEGEQEGTKIVWEAACT